MARFVWISVWLFHILVKCQGIWGALQEPIEKWDKIEGLMKGVNFVRSSRTTRPIPTSVVSVTTPILFSLLTRSHSRRQKQYPMLRFWKTSSSEAEGGIRKPLNANSSIVVHQIKASGVEKLNGKQLRKYGWIGTFLFRGTLTSFLGWFVELLIGCHSNKKFWREEQFSLLSHKVWGWHLHEVSNFMYKLESFSVYCLCRFACVAHFKSEVQ